MVELNCQLIGSCRIQTIGEVYNKHYNALGLSVRFSCIEELTDLLQFKTPYDDPIQLEEKEDFVLRVLQDCNTLERVAFEEVVDRAREGVTYLEIGLTPYLHTKNGLSMVEVVDAVLAGISRGVAATKNAIKVGLVLQVQKDFDYEIIKETILLAYRYSGTAVCALSILGEDNLAKPLFTLSEAFDLIEQTRIPLYVEADDELEIIYAIDHGARRIISGIGAAYSESALKLMKEHNVFVECPLKKHRITGKVTSYEHHPMKTFVSNHIPCLPTVDSFTFYMTNTKENYFEATHLYDISYGTIASSVALIK